MNIEQHLELVQAEAHELLDVAQKNMLTNDQINRLEELKKKHAELKEKVDSLHAAKNIFSGLGNPKEKAAAAETSPAAPLSLGTAAVQAFQKSGVLDMIKDHRLANADMVYKKAAGDTVTTGGISSDAANLLLPDVDKNIVKQHLQRITIADWLGSGTISGNAITYFLEQPWDNTANGVPKAVGENEKKPGVTPPNYAQKTVHLKKIAGWLRMSDEMTEDAEFLAAEINNRLLVQLAIAEENQLLNGDGTGNNLEGLLTRTGVQTENSAKATDNIDAIYRAQNAVFVKTGYRADGLVINPADYQKLRLTRDGNGQYFAGGPFFGQYGTGGIIQDPPVWGLNVIQTTAIPAGTALVGAGKTASTVYRKGNLRVEASNSVGEDFLHNRFVVLAEERLALVTRVPSAFSKIVFSDAAK